MRVEGHCTPKRTTHIFVRERFDNCKRHVHYMVYLFEI